MERARASVDMGNLGRNRTNEIARNVLRSRKGKGGPESSSQTRDDFDADYNQRYGDAMSDDQLEQLLQQNQGCFFHQQDIPQTIDEEELEDDDAVEDEDHGTSDDEEEEAEVATSSQAGGKSESVFKANFTKVKDLEIEIWYATCKHCNKKYNLRISRGYGSATRHLKAKHPAEYVKSDKGKGRQTQISRFATGQPFGNFSYDDQRHLTGMSHLIVEKNLPFIFSESLALKEYAQGSLNPQFRNYSRKIIKKEVIRQYVLEKQKLQTFLQTLMDVLVYVVIYERILIIIYIIWV
ncbi:unnamed protein product [Cuscuta europaea]|uniref:BED-type domain-containing protein n=1 Tax=Cuscuta europaea TaxID=41803 RepID=A0A9P0ZL55_CUSEU|nr:unnamed protein product [Cuscuta europaea]